MAVAVTALIVALGGTSYAVVKPAPRSVGSKELKRNAVTSAHIKANAIKSSDVKDGSLTGKDVEESSLGPVALATRATNVDQAARAGLAGGLDRVLYRVATVTVPTAPAPGESTPGVATARCDPGQLAVGGGVKLDDTMSVEDTYPEGAAAWTANVNNDDITAPRTATVYVVCIPASAPG
jgi:hypothetical protein